MLSADREFFEAERRRAYQQICSLETPPLRRCGVVVGKATAAPSAAAAALPPTSSSKEAASSSLRKSENDIDKYFLLGLRPPISTGYGTPSARSSVSGGADKRKRRKSTKYDAAATAAAAVKPMNPNFDAGVNDNNEGRGAPGWRRQSMGPKKQNSARSLKIIEEVDDIINHQGVLGRGRGDTIPAFEKSRSGTRPKHGTSQESDPLRFQPNVSKLRGININRVPVGGVNVDDGGGGVPRPNNAVNPRRRKKLVSSQVTSVDRLARSKWRRDPIYERLLFLTGHAHHQVEDPDYVHHLDNILQAKHNEKEARRIGELAEIERDREWLWSVKYDLDFAAMEKATLESHRVERKEAADAELNRQDAMFSSAGKQSFYTIATRTHGLDKMRNINDLRAMHDNVIKDNIRRGVANPRCTWLLHAMENEDEAMAEFLATETALELYLGSEKIIQDTMTLQEQQEEEGEEEEDAQESKDGEEDEDF